MSEPGTRPGGLTALAIINFVMAAWNLIGSASVFLGEAGMKFAIQHAEERAAQRSEADRMAETRGAATRRTEDVAKEAEEIEKMRQAQTLFEKHRGFFLLVGTVGVVLALLLLVSGIGYLKLKRGLGRMVGTIYAVAAILWGIAVIVLSTRIDEAASSFGLSNMIGFIYPLITLFTLHRVFKEDFVNP